MPQYWFTEGSRAQELFRQGRLTALHFGGLEIRPTWRIECEHCGQDFDASDVRPRYCGDDCRTAGAREKGRRRVAKHRARSVD